MRWAELMQVERETRLALESEKRTSLLLFDPEKGFKPNPGGQEKFFSFNPVQVNPPDEVCPYRWLGSLGGIGCAHGKTRILTPQGEIRADELAKLGQPIQVMTLLGWQWSPGVYRKGTAELYRVTLASGRQVTVTKQHRFLTKLGWLPLSQVQIGEQVAVGGSEGDQNSSQKSKDSQPSCFRDSGPDDEQPTPHQVFLQELWQLFFGIPLSPSSEFYCSEYSPPSTGGFSPQYSHQVFAWEHLASAGTSQSCLHLEPHTFLPTFHGSSLLGRAGLSRPDKPTKHSVFSRNQVLPQTQPCELCTRLYQEPLPLLPEFDALYKQQEFPHPYTFEPSVNSLLGVSSIPPIKYSAWDNIVAIEFEETGDFYDLHVPVGNHYLANNIWHHNSGKTFCGAIWTFLQSEWYPHLRGMILANNFPQLYQSTLVGLCEAARLYDVPLDPWAESVEEQAIKIANCRRVFIGRKRMFWRVLSAFSFYAGTQSSRGQEVQRIWLDEGAYTPEKGFQTLDGRLRSSRGDACRGIITTTPVGYNWVYYRFADPTRSDALKQTYHMVVIPTRENAKNLGDEYIASLQANYTDELAAQELEGVFLAETKGRLYKYFRRDLHALIGEDAWLVQYDPSLPLHVSFDFNRSPAVAVGAQVKNQEIHFFWEAFIEDADIYELVDTVVDWINDINPGHPSLVVHGDATGRARSIHSRVSSWDVIRDRLRMTGLNIEFKVGNINPPIQNRTNSANCLFKQNRVYVDLEACPYLVRDFEEVQGVGGEIDKHSNQALTHLSDAAGYLIHDIFPYNVIAKPKMIGERVAGLAG